MQYSFTRFSHIALGTVVGIGVTASFTLVALWIADVVGAHQALFGRGNDEGFGFSGNAILLLAVISGLRCGLLIGSPRYRRRGEDDVQGSQTSSVDWIGYINRSAVYFLVLTLPLDFLIHPKGSWFLSIVYVGLGLLALLVAVSPLVVRTLEREKTEEE